MKYAEIEERFDNLYDMLKHLSSNGEARVQPDTATEALQDLKAIEKYIEELEMTPEEEEEREQEFQQKHRDRY